MPTILLILGWRLYFYSNEGHEPIHVHAEKGDTECKFWLFPDKFEISEAYSHQLSAKENREIRRIIFGHYDIIVEAWNEHFKKGK